MGRLVRRLVATAHDASVALLREYRDKLDSLVEELLEHETLDEADAYAAAGITRTVDVEAPVAAA